MGYFTAMPLSTFLPANLDCRRRLEGEMLAVRAVAWIGADDCLDALDGTLGDWDLKAFSTFTERISVVKTALSQCLVVIAGGPRVRVVALIKAIEAAESAVLALEGPVSFEAINRLRSIQHIRHFWHAWGPVDRLPGINDGAARTGIMGVNTRATRRVRTEHTWRWDTL